jgi:shikimate kinase
MKETGKIICLSATPKVILARTRHFIHRPLLNVPHPENKIELLLKLRAPYYALADKAINTSKLTIPEVIAKILKILKPQSQKRR